MLFCGRLLHAPAGHLKQPNSSGTRPPVLLWNYPVNLLRNPLDTPQDSVEVLVKAENTEIYRRLRAQLGKLHDITRIILRIKKARPGTIIVFYNS